MVRPSAFSHESLALQYHALLEVAESIAAHHDLSELFRDLAQKLPRVVQCSSVALGLHNVARHTMQMHILEHVGPGPLAPDMEYPIDDVPGGWVWQHQEPLICQDVENESRFPKVMPLIRQAGVRSFCTVPLTTARRRIGAMGVGTRELHHYDAAEIEFLQQAAKQVAVAVDNALNYAHARAAERDLRLLLEINNALVSHLELRELLRTISSSLRRVIPHDLAGLTLYDPETRHLIAHALDFPHNQEFVQAGVPIPLEGTPEGLAFTSREPVLIQKLGPIFVRQMDGDQITLHHSPHARHRGLEQIPELQVRRQVVGHIHEQPQAVAFLHVPTFRRAGALEVQGIFHRDGDLQSDLTEQTGMLVRERALLEADDAQRSQHLAFGNQRHGATGLQSLGRRPLDDVCGKLVKIQLLNQNGFA